MGHHAGLFLRRGTRTRGSHIDVQSAPSPPPTVEEEDEDGGDNKIDKTIRSGPEIAKVA